MPIAFGCMLVNLPLSGIVDPGGFLYFVKFGIDHELYPVIIFMGIGALDRLWPAPCKPNNLLLGAAAQIGVFFAVFGAMAMGLRSRKLQVSVLSEEQTVLQPYTFVPSLQKAYFLQLR